MRYCFILFMMCFTQLFANIQDSTSLEDNTNLSVFSDTLKKDTTCYKFKFLDGDTLIYKIVSLDSIIMGYDLPLIKNRIEKLRIVCDSIDKAGLYNLSFELIGFNSTERQGDNKSIVRTSNAWLHRKSFIRIDSIGIRYGVSIDDSTKASLSPGGGFQPFLFSQLKESCKIQDETWTHTYLMELAENGYPYPLVRMSYLYRAKGLKDTLGKSFKHYEYINTGQGSIELNSNEAKVNISNVINAHSRVFLDKDFNRIVYQFTTQEQKLKIKGKSQDPVSGSHFTNSEFFLESYLPKLVLDKPDKNQKKNKKK